MTPVPDAPGIGIGRRTPINNWTDAVAHGEVLALDPRTGRQVWSFKQYDVTDSGILTTATDLLFTGGREGYFHALNARTGQLLWKVSLGGQIVTGRNQLRDRRQTVRRDDLGQQPRRVRIARLRCAGARLARAGAVRQWAGGSIG